VWPWYGARRSRTAHDLSTAKICYRHHPCYGVEVEVVRHLRRIGSAILIVRLPDGLQLAVPEWMLSQQVCRHLTDEIEPRIAIDALEELRRLIDSQKLTSDRAASGCAESSAGGNHAQQRDTGRRSTGASVRRQRDLERASRASPGTLPKTLAPVAGKRSRAHLREAK
jgi:hypothetical protein